MKIFENRKFQLKISEKSKIRKFPNSKIQKISIEILRFFDFQKFRFFDFSKIFQLRKCFSIFFFANFPLMFLKTCKNHHENRVSFFLKSRECNAVAWESDEWSYISFRIRPVMTKIPAGELQIGESALHYTPKTDVIESSPYVRESPQMKTRWWHLFCASSHHRDKIKK